MTIRKSEFVALGLMPSCGSKISMVPAMIITFSTVPTPGLSLRGIQRRSTTILTKNVAVPMLVPIMNEMPSARTVQGVTPQSALIITASPKPNRNRPSTSIDNVLPLGRIECISVELHHVVGMSRPIRLLAMSFPCLIPPLGASNGIFSH